MKVIFIRPEPSSDTIGLQHIMVVEPLELEILATLIENDHDVEIFDLILEDESYDSIILKSKPDVVCFTGYITHTNIIKEKCTEAKNIFPNVITIVGGVHFEKFPEDIAHKSIDYIVVRNATRTFPELIKYIKEGGAFPRGVSKGTFIANLPEFDFYLPVPNRKLTDKYRDKYFYVFHNKVALLKTSFGCPYNCNFCFCREITDGNYVERLISEVVEELITIKEDEIYIVDDDFLLNPNRVREFLRELKIHGIKKKFLVYGRADFIVKYPDIIKEFKDLGLRTIIVGLESFKDIELDGFNKNSTSETNVKALKIMNTYGVDCYAAVIVSPDWTQQDFKKAGDVILKLGIKFVNLQPLTPLKGTGLENIYTNLVVNREDYARWDLAHITVMPEMMSVNEFYRSILKLYQKIVLNPRNIISHFRYPLHMQIKVMRGIKKVRKQYKERIIHS